MFDDERQRMGTTSPVHYCDECGAVATSALRDCDELPSDDSGFRRFKGRRYIYLCDLHCRPSREYRLDGTVRERCGFVRNLES